MCGQSYRRREMVHEKKVKDCNHVHVRKRYVPFSSLKEKMSIRVKHEVHHEHESVLKGLIKEAKEKSHITHIEV